MTQSSFRATALPIAVATFATMLGVGMLVPALPGLVASSEGGVVAAGGLLSAFGLARLVMNFPGGMMADRIGIAPTATIGLALLAIGSLVGVVTTVYAALFATIALQGAGAALFATSSMTALVLAGGPERRGAAMSWYMGALLLAMSVGPVLGGLIVTRFGAHAPFGLQAVLALAALVAVRRMPTASAGVAKGPPATFRSLFGAALLGAAAVGFAAFFCRVGVAWSVVPAVARDVYGLDTATVGWIVGVGTAANLLVMPVSARLIDGWGSVRTAVASVALSAAGLLLMRLAPSVPALWIGTAVVVAGTGTMIPAASAAALAGVPRSATGRTMSLVRMAGDVGMAAGPVGLPAVTGLLGLPVSEGFTIGAVALALAALTLVLAVGRRTVARAA